MICFNSLPRATARKGEGLLDLLPECGSGAVDGASRRFGRSDRWRPSWCDLSDDARLGSILASKHRRLDVIDPERDPAVESPSEQLDNVNAAHAFISTQLS